MELLREAEIKQESTQQNKDAEAIGVLDVGELSTVSAVGKSATQQAFQERFKSLREEEGLVDVRKGRRRKPVGAVPLHEDLFEWLKVRRPQQYTNLGTHQFGLKCQVCSEEFKAVRSNTIYFVLQHEAQAVHHDAVLHQERRSCSGLRLVDTLPAHKTRAHDFVGCFRTWALHECPWHFKQYSVTCTVDDEGAVVVRAKKCSDQKLKLAPGFTACKSCIGLCRTGDFCKKVATWAFRLDLAKFVAATFLEDMTARCTLLESMAEASWQMVHPCSIDALAEEPYAALYDKLQNLVVSIPISCRNPAMQRFMVTRFDWLPRDLAKGQLDTASSGRALKFVDILLEAKSAKASPGNNAHLCQQIISGVLDGDALARTMITGILRKAERAGQGKRRVNTSTLPGVEPSAIAEVGFALSSCTRQESLMKMFGLIAPKQSGVDIWRDHLPLFFAPSLSSDVQGGCSQLEKNARLVLSLFGRECEARRDYMLAFDETTYWPQYNLQMFPPPTGLAYVGGADARSILPSSEHAPGTLLKTQLSQTCVSYLLKRASTRKEPFDILMGPKRQSSVNAQSVLHLTGSVWQAVTKAASGVPPICQACDNHAAHGLMNGLFLAQLNQDQVATVPFFCECSAVKRKYPLPLYRFGSMEYRGHVIFGHNDAAHTQKCLARALRAKSRILFTQGLRVTHQVLLILGLPATSFRGNDSQSDTEAAWLFNPSLLDLSQWDAFGPGMNMYFTALCTGSWLASHRFSPKTLLDNVLSGYYLLLFDVMESGLRTDKFFHMITVTNILASSGHLTQRLLDWPENCPFRPSATTEDACEHHFGRTKSGIKHRLPTIRAAILATQNLHLQQSRELSKPNQAKISQWAALSDKDAEEIGNRAFEAVCRFKAVTSVGRDMP